MIPSEEFLKTSAAELLTEVVLPFRSVAIDQRPEGIAESRQCKQVESGLHGLSLQGSMRDNRTSASEGSASSAVDSASSEAKCQDGDDTGTSGGSQLPRRNPSASVAEEQIDPGTLPGVGVSSPEYTDEVIDLDSPARRSPENRTEAQVNTDIHRGCKNLSLEQTDGGPICRDELHTEGFAGRAAMGEGGIGPVGAPSAANSSEHELHTQQAQEGTTMEDSDDDDVEYLGSLHESQPTPPAQKETESKKRVRAGKGGSFENAEVSGGAPNVPHSPASRRGGRGPRFWYRQEVDHMASLDGLTIDPSSGSPLSAYLHVKAEGASRKQGAEAEAGPVREENFDELVEEDESTSEDSGSAEGDDDTSSTERLFQEDDSDDDLVFVGCLPPQGTHFSSRQQQTSTLPNEATQHRRESEQPSPRKKTAGIHKKVAAAAAFRFSARVVVDASDDEEGEDDVVMADADTWAAAAKKRKLGGQALGESFADCNGDVPQSNVRAEADNDPAGPSSSARREGADWAATGAQRANEQLHPESLKAAATPVHDSAYSMHNIQGDGIGLETHQPMDDVREGEKVSEAETRNTTMETEGLADLPAAEELRREWRKETEEYKQAQEELWRQRQEVIQKQPSSTLSEGLNAALEGNLRSKDLILLEGLQEGNVHQEAEASAALEREEAQLLKKRKREQQLAEQRKQESEARQQRRLEEVRLQQDQEAQHVASKEQMRSAVAADLELRTKNCRDLGSALVRLGIPVEGQPNSSDKQVMDAYKKALRKFHPDSISRNGITEPRKQVEAEEAFKLIQRLKANLPLTPPALPSYERLFSQPSSYGGPWWF